MQFDERIHQMHAQVSAWRRDLHAHPELAFEENRTSEFVAHTLQGLGLDVSTSIAKTGVVGTLTCGSGGKSVALRADMDALPLSENNSFAHRSRHSGRMHACGHDGHTAMLLGAARFMAQARGFNGTVHFVFQPAEEGHAGGKLMVEEGLFERFQTDAVFAIHNWPGLATGKIATRPGPLMAALETFEIEITGKGCHAAMPHLGVDPIAVGAQLVSALQTVVARGLDPLESGVLSVTQFHSGDAMAIIPERALLKGTCRSFNPRVSQDIELRLRRLAEQISLANGARAEVKYERRYPPTINTEAEAQLALDCAREVVGEQQVETNPKPSMGAEDFAFMLNEKPGAYIWLGNGSTEGGCLLHNPNYDFNDEVIPIGIAYWDRLARRFLAA